MAAVRDDFSDGKSRKTSKNLKQEYTTFINMDRGLVEARRWIERVTFTPFKYNDFRESLLDGVLLCELVVNVASISIGRINRSSTPYASTDNIKLFQRACETLGFNKSQLFDITDLQEVPVKRGQSVHERAKESQRRLAKVACTIYWLGKYANDNLNFTGSSSLDESCFQHLVENQLPELPEIEGPDTKRRVSQSEPTVGQTEPTELIKEKHEIVTETIDFGTKREAFKQLEEESKRVQEEVEKQRRRSFSSSEKENKYIGEEIDRRRKSLGSKPVWKEGDSKYKHKKEILGGWKDPIKNRRERITRRAESPPKETRPVNMRSPGDMQTKLSRYEQMQRQASEESEVLQGKRTRPKSWGGGELPKVQGGALMDKTNKFESLQRQADKESAVLHGELRMPAVNNDVKRQNRAPVLSTGTVKLKDKHSKYEKLDKAAQQQTLVLEGKHHQVEDGFEYDIGDKISGPVALPGGADVKLQDKKRQFESLDYKAHRESAVLKLRSGKSLDDLNQQSMPLNTASRRAEPRPKSNVFEYQRFPADYEAETSNRDVEMRTFENESIQTREMNFTESTPEQYEASFQNHLESSRKPVSPTPAAPPRGDSLRYNALTKRPEETIRKETNGKTSLYSSFAQPEKDPGKEGSKRPPLNYKEFISYPVAKQRDRVERYNAAVQQLSKAPEKKPISSDQSTTRPRKKSIGNDEWIKVRPVEEPTDDIPKRPIQKLWDREPEDEDSNQMAKPSAPVDTSFRAVEKSTYVPDVKSMTYRDFVAPPKSVVKDHVVKSSFSVVESSGPRKMSGSGPYSNFAQPKPDPSQPSPQVSMSYRDFVVPPPKGDSAADRAEVKAKKVKDLTKKFTELEAEQFKPKESGPPKLKSLVDRDELVRYERESRARSWYGGPLGLEDEELEGAYRRRVRRWSDYEYEEGDKIRSSPWEHIEGGQPNGDMQDHKYQDIRDDTSDQYQAYNRPLEPETEVREKTQVERISEPQPSQSLERSVEPINDASEPVSYSQTYGQDYQSNQIKPVKSILQHSKPAEPEQESQKEEEMGPREGSSSYGRAYQPIKTIGTRSWNDFESSRRKKSMELIENRPTARPYESKERETAKGEIDLYKLKRPADYIPKYKSDPGYKPSSQPTETYQHYFQSTQQDDFAPQETLSQSDSYHQEPLPTSYPTYYHPETDDQHPKASRSTEIVEAGKPLIVSAKLHDEKKDPKPIHKPVPQGDRTYEFVANSETSNVTESAPGLESVPKTDFKAQQKLWEDLSTSHNYKEPVEEPSREQEARQPDIKAYVEPRVSQEPQNVQRLETHVGEKESVPVTKPKRPQVFAIVGQGRQVRPLVAEIPEPTAVSPKRPKEETIAPIVTKDDPIIQEQTKQQQQINRRLISPSLSGAKVFHFGEQTKEDTTRNYVQPEVIPSKKEPIHKKQTVVMETVSVVEKSRGVEDDIFKVLEEHDDDDEKFRRSIKNPEYREKLRKEVEEKNRKQREEARYLTNLQMRQSLGAKEENKVEEGQVKLEHFEGLENAGDVDYMYDYNANRRNDVQIPRKTYHSQADRYDDQWNRETNDKHRVAQERLDYERHREQERLEYERREQERLEYERREQERLEYERRERERLEYERRERERLENQRREQERLEYERREQERLEYERREQERLENQRKEQERLENQRREQERLEYERREQERLEYERREQERLEYERREQERLEQERLENQRREQERLEYERREQDRLEYERREQERLEYERREQERLEYERREQERLEQERLENQRREQERLEYERREQERLEDERRERERLENQRREQERLKYERREQERLEYERREQERLEYERKERERLEHERKERERLEYERREQERLEHERKERERLEHERKERERLEHERKERERLEYERKERERLEHERKERERLEYECKERERLEYERKEQERLEYERKEQERLENERQEQERLENERREQERLEHERIEQQFREQERRDQEQMEQERRKREQLSRHEQDRRRQGDVRYPGRTRERDSHEYRHQERQDPRYRETQDYRGQERHDPRYNETQNYRDQERHDPRYKEKETQNYRHQGRHDPRYREETQNHRDQERHDPRYREETQNYRHQERHDPRYREETQNHRDRERHDPRYRKTQDNREQERHEQRDRRHSERDRNQRDRREQERLDQEHRERERRERHRFEQEHLQPEEKERHRLKQQHRVHELMEEQQRQEEYRKSLSRQDHQLHSSNYSRQQSDNKWTKIEDGSRYSIYETMIAADQKRLVCASCGESINKGLAMFVEELNRYWHKNCFQCVVCQVIFGSKEQRSPLVVSNSLLHCENCFITNEGEKYTEV